MSVTFRPALDGGGRPLLRCACPADLDAAIADPCPACRATLNISNANAFELLAWLGLPASSDLSGAIDAPALLALCEASIPLPGEDQARPTTTQGRVTTCGREAGYVARRVNELATIPYLQDLIKKAERK